MAFNCPGTSLTLDVPWSQPSLGLLVIARVVSWRREGFSTVGLARLYRVVFGGLRLFRFRPVIFELADIEESMGPPVNIAAIVHVVGTGTTLLRGASIF